jgi:hypothetical protein
LHASGTAAEPGGTTFASAPGRGKSRHLSEHKKTGAGVKSFIRVTEIWVPSKDRGVLEFHGGLYGAMKGFRAVSERMCFGYGEGLPGRAWAERRPIVLKELQHSYFMRAPAARDAGLSCGVALPIFAGDYLLAVVVLFCGSEDLDDVGAIELWHNDPAESMELGLTDGYFGNADSFELVARRTKFRPGFGLPGTAWQSGMPEVMKDLGHSTRFLRRDDARRIGINKGLGVPLDCKPGHADVLALLSATDTPIARRFEVWVPEADGLVFLSGECDVNRDFPADYEGVSIASGEGPVGLVALTGLPVVRDRLGEDASAVGASAFRAGLDAMLALPVLSGGRLKAVVGLYF